MVTIWTLRAEAQLMKAYLYIHEDSPQNAQWVKDQIVDLSLELPKNPERFPLDKLYEEGTHTTVIKRIYGLLEDYQKSPGNRGSKKL